MKQFNSRTTGEDPPVAGHIRVCNVASRWAVRLAISLLNPPPGLREAALDAVMTGAAKGASLISGLKVLSPGLHTIRQDLGRIGY